MWSLHQADDVYLMMTFCTAWVQVASMLETASMAPALTPMTPLNIAQKASGNALNGAALYIWLLGCTAVILTHRAVKQAGALLGIHASKSLLRSEDLPHMR